MADTNFNYSAQAFLQHAEQPDFWHYALRLANNGSRYEIRLDKPPLRMPIAA